MDRIYHPHVRIYHELVTSDKSVDGWYVTILVGGMVDYEGYMLHSASPGWTIICKYMSLDTI